MNPFRAIGAGLLALLRSAGAVALFAGQALAALGRPP